MLVSFAILGGCTPTIRIEAPERPIEINLNVKIDQEIRIRLDKDVEDMIASNPDLFQ
ncbi:MAG: YnbE family lipoprotein [Robiginitomaculum sp.]|nr:MAG: YnbE family lipoprotein [Robiginitomaculum sp.]